MKQYFYLLAALLLIVCGSVLLTRKKLIISRAIEQSFVITIIFSNLILSALEDRVGYLGLIITIGIHVSFIFISTFFLRGKYMIYNINMKEANLLLEQILMEKNYDNKDIKFDSSFLNSVELNLKEIKGTQVYDDILYELKKRLQSMEKKFFPYTGIFYIVLGVFLLWMIVS